MIKVLELREGAVVVDARKLRRVVIQPHNEIVRELCGVAEARAYITCYNKRPGKTWAEAITYQEAFQRASNSRATETNSSISDLT